MTGGGEWDMMRGRGHEERMGTVVRKGTGGGKD